MSWHPISFKNNGLVLLYKTYFGIETVAYCLLLWIARMYVDWNLKKLAKTV